MTGPRPSRRSYLAGLSAVAATALAGCTAIEGAFSRETPEPPSYDYLKQTPTYVADGVDLTLPAGVPRVDAVADAALVVLPDDTDMTAEVAVNRWLDGAGIALVGQESEATFHAWQSTDPYEETFDHRGRADSSPDPDVLVTFAIGEELVGTYGTTWADTDDPSDRRVLSALEDALAVEAEEGRPRGNATATPTTGESETG